LEAASPAAKAFNNLARRILGEKVPFNELDYLNNKGFFGRIKRMLGI